MLSRSYHSAVCSREGRRRISTWLRVELNSGELWPSKSALRWRTCGAADLSVARDLRAREPPEWRKLLFVLSVLNHRCLCCVPVTMVTWADIVYLSHVIYRWAPPSRLSCSQVWAHVTVLDRERLLLRWKEMKGICSLNTCDRTVPECERDSTLTLEETCSSANFDLDPWPACSMRLAPGGGGGGLRSQLLPQHRSIPSRWSRRGARVEETRLGKPLKEFWFL